jgi:hypothetical protein
MDIKCVCDKLLARYEKGSIILYCKRCRKEIKINIDEIRAKEPRQHV